MAAAALLAALLAGWRAPAAVHADHKGATVGWTGALPPLPGGGGTADPARGCGPRGLACVRAVEGRLADLARRLGCDHRAVFATTYWLLTRELRRQLERGPGPFRDPAWVGRLAAVFFEAYRRTLAADEAGEPVPAAWRVALDAAREGDHTAGQDLLLGVNAHVQRDMPFALAAVGLWTPDGTSRKPDHDAMNRVLSRAYDAIVPEIARRFDPSMYAADAKPSPADDLAAPQLVAAWREGVWRNAERLVAARTEGERRGVRLVIEAHAEAWARALAAGQVPGYRRVRDAYCARVGAPGG